MSLFLAHLPAFVGELAFEGVVLQRKLNLVLIGCPLWSYRWGYMLFLDPSQNDVGIFRMRIVMIHTPNGYLFALGGSGWCNSLRGDLFLRGHHHWWGYLRRNFFKKVFGEGEKTLSVYSSRSKTLGRENENPCWEKANRLLVCVMFLVSNWSEPPSHWRSDNISIWLNYWCTPRYFRYMQLHDWYVVNSS